MELNDNFLETIEKITKSKKAYNIYDKYKDDIKQQAGDKKIEKLADMLTEVFADNNDRLKLFFKNFSDMDNFKFDEVVSLCPGFETAGELNWSDFKRACSTAHRTIRTKKEENNRTEVVDLGIKHIMGHYNGDYL